MVLGDFFKPEILDQLLLSLKPGEGIGVQGDRVVRYLRPSPSIPKERKKTKRGRRRSARS